MSGKQNSAVRSSLAALLMASYLCGPGVAWSPSADSQVGGNSEPCQGAERHLRAAQKALDQGNLDEAERLLTPLQASYPKCNQILVGLARVQALRKDPVTAREIFSRAIDLAPDDARSYYYFSEFFLSQGQYQQADYFSEQAVYRDPEYPDALTLRGKILVMKHQTAAARELLDRACKLDSDNAEAHYQLGVLFDNSQMHAEAVQEFKKVIALRPRDPRAYDYLALNLESLGEAERAKVAFQMGLRVNKGPLSDSFLDYNYGRLLMKTNRLAESKVYLDRALRLAPQTRAVHYEHGRLNLRMQKYKEAQVDAERALSLADPSGFVLDLQIYYLLATVSIRLGNNELARKYAALCRTSRVPIQSEARGDH